MSGRSLDPDGNLWDLIAFELRRQREARGDSLATIGMLIDRDRSAVAHVESGRVKLQEAHAKKIDDEWSTGGMFRRLVRFAKAGHDKEWFQAHLDLEARASELRIWELSWIPGLLQTEGYVRAAVKAAGVEDVDAHVARRVRRQETLNRKPRPLVWVCLDQGVIEQPVGSAEVMREQLALLLELAQLPNITIRVMPRSVGAHVGRDGSFKIMTVGGADVAYTEASEGGRLAPDATDVRSFRVRFDRIGDRALPIDDSISLITQTMEGLH